MPAHSRATVGTTLLGYALAATAKPASVPWRRRFASPGSPTSAAISAWSGPTPNPWLHARRTAPRRRCLRMRARDHWHDGTGRPVAGERHRCGPGQWAAILLTHLVECLRHGAERLGWADRTGAPGSMRVVDALCREQLAAKRLLVRPRPAASLRRHRRARERLLGGSGPPWSGGRPSSLIRASPNHASVDGGPDRRRGQDEPVGLPVADLQMRGVVSIGEGHRIRTISSLGASLSSI